MHPTTKKKTDADFLACPSTAVVSANTAVNANATANSTVPPMTIEDCEALVCVGAANSSQHILLEPVDTPFAVEDGEWDYYMG